MVDQPDERNKNLESELKFEDVKWFENFKIYVQGEILDAELLTES